MAGAAGLIGGGLGLGSPIPGVPRLSLSPGSKSQVKNYQEAAEVVMVEDGAHM